MSSLQDHNAEYAELLSQKRKVYATYKQARADRKELFNVKSNVEYLPEIGQEHGGERDSG